MLPEAFWPLFLTHLKILPLSEAGEKTAAELGLLSDLSWQSFSSPDRLVELLSYWLDERALQTLRACDMEGWRTHEKIAHGVMVRLKCLEKDREAAARLSSYLLLPHRALLASRCVWQTCSTLWYWAGDQATDFNYYSKRLLLAGVYTSTFLYWLQDTSEEFQETHAFLQRRLKEVSKIPTVSLFLKKIGERIIGKG